MLVTKETKANASDQVKLTIKVKTIIQNTVMGPDYQAFYLLTLKNERKLRMISSTHKHIFIVLT